jgi:hypothetical protein
VLEEGDTLAFFCDGIIVISFDRACEESSRRKYGLVGLVRLVEYAARHEVAHGLKLPGENTEARARRFADDYAPADPSPSLWGKLPKERYRLKERP